MSLLFALFKIAVGAVTTSDATPLVAPYKISDKTGKNQASVTFNLDGHVTAVMVRKGGTDPTTGTLVGMLGAVADVSKVGAKVAPHIPLQNTDPMTIAYADIPSPGEGDNTLLVYAHTTDGSFA